MIHFDKLKLSIFGLLLILQIPLIGQNYISEEKNITLGGFYALDTNTNGQISSEETCNVYYKIGAISAATGLLFLVDNSIRNNLKNISASNNNILLKAGHEYGEIYYSMGLAGALYLTQFLFDDHKAASTGKVLFESLVISSIAAISIKYIFGRSRPYTEDGSTKFNWFETDNKYNSLPSGHVITAFTTSTVLARSIGNTYVSIALYGMAGLTAYQRIASDNHWFSDAFLGAAIGILVGEYFSKINESKSEKSNSYNLIPFFSRNSSGISLTINL